MTVYTDENGREYVSTSSGRVYLDDLSMGDVNTMDKPQLEEIKLESDTAAREIQSREQRYDEMAAGVIEEQQMMDY